jgi:hypothetical protein
VSNGKNLASGRAKVPIFLVNIDDGIEPLAWYSDGGANPLA